MMMTASQRRLRPPLLVALWLVAMTLFWCMGTMVQAADNDSKNWFAQAKESYENLPDQGKFATGAVCGFGASKLVVNSGERSLFYRFSRNTPLLLP
jgi:hypothetical protein